MYVVFSMIYLLVAISLVLLIMLQDGNGIDISSSFNVRGMLGGVGGSIVSNLMIRLTTILGVLFFFLSVLLGNISSKCIQQHGELNNSNVLEKLHDGVNKLNDINTEK